MVILDEFQQFVNLHTHTYAHPHMNLSSFFFFWSIVGSWCFVNLCCIAKWLSYTQIDTDLCIFFYHIMKKLLKMKGIVNQGSLGIFDPSGTKSFPKILLLACFSSLSCSILTIYQWPLSLSCSILTIYQWPLSLVPFMLYTSDPKTELVK